jgi:hypothetical protein
LNRKLGRAGEARKIESELLSLFTNADSDFSLARVLHGTMHGEQIAQSSDSY